MNYDYDEGSDVLYAFIGEPTEAIFEEIANGILLRRHIDTNELCGFTIIDYSRQWERGPMVGPHFENVQLPRPPVAA